MSPAEELLEKLQHDTATQTPNQHQAGGKPWSLSLIY
jgi:hypothetical protein